MPGVREHSTGRLVRGLLRRRLRLDFKPSSRAGLSWEAALPAGATGWLWFSARFQVEGGLICVPFLELARWAGDCRPERFALRCQPSGRVEGALLLPVGGHLLRFQAGGWAGRFEFADASLREVDKVELLARTVAAERVQATARRFAQAWDEGGLHAIKLALRDQALRAAQPITYAEWVDRFERLAASDLEAIRRLQEGVGSVFHLVVAADVLGDVSPLVGSLAQQLYPRWKLTIRYGCSGCAS